MSAQDSRIQLRKEAESLLQLHLNSIIELIKTEENKDISYLQSKYGKRIQEYLRAGAEAGYKQGLDYVTFVKQIPSFLTSIDLKQIQDLATDFYDPFWRRLNIILHRNDTLSQRFNYEPRSELNANYIATVMAITLTTRAVAVGTISKLQQIQTAEAIKQGGLRALFRFKDIVDTMKGVVRDNEIDQLQWNAILDRKTCPTCRALDGTIWNYNDPQKPIPGDDYSIHPNCRCFYDILPREADIFGLATAAQAAILVRRLQNLPEDLE